MQALHCAPFHRRQYYARVPLKCVDLKSSRRSVVKSDARARALFRSPSEIALHAGAARVHRRRLTLTFEKPGGREALVVSRAQERRRAWVSRFAGGERTEERTRIAVKPSHETSFPSSAARRVGTLTLTSMRQCVDRNIGEHYTVFRAVFPCGVRSSRDTRQRMTLIPRRGGALISPSRAAARRSVAGRSVPRLAS